MISFCNPDYSIYTEDKHSFKPVNFSSNNLNILESFNYTSSDDLDSLNNFGIYTNYMGGGYVYKINSDDLNEIQSDLNILQNLSWIDRQTSALFVEFSLFNPNINLFSYCSILFEILPTGNLIKSAKFYPMNLYESKNDSFVSFRMTFNVFFVILITALIINESVSILKSGFLNYFRNIWNYVELNIIGFSFASLVMFLYRLYAINKISKLIKNKEESTYIRLEYLSYCNETLSLCLGFCAFFGTIRFLKLLRFNSRIMVFMNAFRKSLPELAGFFLVFCLVYACFSQTFYFLFNDKIVINSTVLKSFETCFLILLGKFNAIEILSISPLLGLSLFVSYNIIMAFVVLNLMISILCDSFSEIRLDNYENDNDPDLVEYLKSCFKIKFFSDKSSNEQNNQPVYIEKNFQHDFKNLFIRLDKVRIYFKF